MRKLTLLAGLLGACCCGACLLGCATDKFVGAMSANATGQNPALAIIWRTDIGLVVQLDNVTVDAEAKAEGEGEQPPERE